MRKKCLRDAESGGGFLGGILGYGGGFAALGQGYLGGREACLVVAGTELEITVDGVVGFGELDFLIEFQGKQHYSSVSKYGGARGLHRQQYNDTLKRKYCLKNRIKLVTIPYYDENKLSYDYIMTAAGY